MEAPAPQPTTPKDSLVRYRVGLNPIQQAVHDYVVNMDVDDVGRFVEAFRREVTLGHLAPIFPTVAMYTPNDLVEYAGLHADTVDKYLHSYIGVWANAPDYKQERMTRLHEDAPWGTSYAEYLTEPLPLRLVSARALVFIVMAPTSVYRPTTGDEELLSRWRRLVHFRATAQLRFGVPKGAAKRIEDSAPTTTSVRRTPHAKKDTNPMPDIESLFVPPCEPKPALPEPPKPPVVGTTLTVEQYFAAIADLRAKTERLRGLLDLLPAQEVEDRVAEFFRAGLNVLDKERTA
jgi:hypothetical protein